MRSFMNSDLEVFIYLSVFINRNIIFRASLSLCYYNKLREAVKLINCRKLFLTIPGANKSKFKFLEVLVSGESYYRVTLQQGPGHHIILGEGCSQITWQKGGSAERAEHQVP